jgi:hypothetical protein
MAACTVTPEIAEPAPQHAPNDADPIGDSPDPGPSPCSTSSGTELAISVRRRPIPRKGHTKSRRGCFNCKRRKVKCQETLPACSHCTRIGLVCEYPDSLSRSSLTASSSSSSLSSVSPDSSLVILSSPTAALQSTPTLFTGTDMLFFHHFLVTAYPPLPIRGDDIWRNVAVLSHNVCSLPWPMRLWLTVLTVSASMTISCTPCWV